MPEANPFPLNIPQKVNSPELLAFFQQFGLDKYLSAEEINKITSALTFLFENIGGGSLAVSGITTLGTIAIDGDQVTFSGFAWKIAGTDYAQAAPITRTLPFASEGMYRTHTAYFTTTNDINIAVGPEDDEVTTEPNIPAGTLRMRAFNVFGEVITVGPGESLPFYVGLLDELLQDPQPDDVFLINVMGIDLRIKWSRIVSALGASSGSQNENKGAFTGVFDMSNGKNNFYSDYIEGSAITLSLSTTKTLGTICKVRVKGSLLNQTIPDTWILRGQPFSSDLLELNDIVIMYVNDDEIIIVNNIVSLGSVQQYPYNFSSERAWHKFDIATTTEVSGNVTASADSLITTPHNLTGVGTILRSVQNDKQCVALDDSYFRFEPAFSSVFQNSFSVSMKVKLDDGRPSVTRYLCSLRVGTTSRFWIDYRSDGKINVAYTSNSVSVFAQSLSANFLDGAMSDFNHVVVTVQNGGFIKIYLNGLLVPLHATLNGNMATVNMSLFQTTGNFLIGYDSAATVFSKQFVKDFIVQPIVYTPEMITELLNMP